MGHFTEYPRVLIQICTIQRTLMACCALLLDEYLDRSYSVSCQHVTRLQLLCSTPMTCTHFEASPYIILSNVQWSLSLPPSIPPQLPTSLSSMPDDPMLSVKSEKCRYYLVRIHPLINFFSDKHLRVLSLPRIQKSNYASIISVEETSSFASTVPPISSERRNAFARLSSGATSWRS